MADDAKREKFGGDVSAQVLGEFAEAAESASTTRSDRLLAATARTEARIAANDDRVLVSGDVTTMPAHFAEFVSRQESPGLLLVPSRRSIGSAIEGLLIVWLTWTPADLRNQARWLP